MSTATFDTLTTARELEAAGGAAAFGSPTNADRAGSTTTTCGWMRSASRQRSHQPVSRSGRALYRAPRPSSRGPNRGRPAGQVEHVDSLQRPARHVPAARVEAPRELAQPPSRHRGFVFEAREQVRTALTLE